MPAVVGAPVIAPVVALIESPSGRPDADHATVAADELSVADGVTVVTVDPVTLFRFVMADTDTVLPIVQVNEVEPAKAELSVAVRVTEQVQAVVGVPVMAPVVALIDSPTGRPEAVQINVAVDDVSVPVGVRVEIAEPEPLDLPEMAVTSTPLVTVQVKLVEPEKPDSSVAVRVTG